MAFVLSFVVLWLCQNFDMLYETHTSCSIRNLRLIRVDLRFWWRLQDCTNTSFLLDRSREWSVPVLWMNFEWLIDILFIWNFDMSKLAYMDFRWLLFEVNPSYTRDLAEVPSWDEVSFSACQLVQENEFFPIFVIWVIYLVVVCLIWNLGMLVWDYTTCCMPSLRLKFCLHESI